MFTPYLLGSFYGSSEEGRRRSSTSAVLYGLVSALPQPILRDQASHYGRLSIYFTSLSLLYLFRSSLNAIYHACLSHSIVSFV